MPKTNRLNLCFSLVLISHSIGFGETHSCDDMTYLFFSFLFFIEIINSCCPVKLLLARCGCTCLCVTAALETDAVSSGDSGASSQHRRETNKQTNSELDWSIGGKRFEHNSVICDNQWSCISWLACVVTGLFVNNVNCVGSNGTSGTSVVVNARDIYLAVRVQVVFVHKQPVL